jgi:hypothetical protein
MKISSYAAALLLACSLSVVPAPAVQAQASDAGMTAAQLEQLVAPIALYPDALLTQILMASTYPLEVVEAQRWVSQNAKLKGEALDAALKDKDWDPSVKALCGLPDVLKKMSDNLDWTQDLGDAFLGQKTELMDTVQRMRGKALEAGNLKTTEQQVVKQEPDKIIVIESAEPDVVYVPTYSSTVVYGGWGYPTYYYPPMYVPPPPGYGLISFGVGMAVGAAIWGDCNWGWGHSDVDIDIDRYNEFNRNTNVNADRDRLQGGQGNRGQWQHDPSHRKGVNYRNQDVAQKYGARGGETRVSRDQARGWSGGQAGDRTAGASRGDVGGRTGAPGVSTSDRSRAAGSTGQLDRGGAGAGGQVQPSRQPSSRDTAMSGSRSPSMDRASSSRGSMSRGTPSYGGRSMGGGGRRR